MNKEQAADGNETRARMQKEMDRLNVTVSEDGPSSSANRSQFEAQRLVAIRWISNETGLPMSLIEQRTWVEHNVIATLLSEGEQDLARVVALDPVKARQEHSDLFKNAEGFRWLHQSFNDAPKNR